MVCSNSRKEGQLNKNRK